MPDYRDVTNDLLQVIMEYERQRSPFDFTAGGFSIWPLFRVRVASRLLSHMEGREFHSPYVKESNPRILANMVKGLPWQLGSLFKASGGGGQRVLGRIESADRKDRVDGREYSIYFDYLAPCVPGFMLSEPLASRSRGQPYPSVFNEYVLPTRLFRRPRYRGEADALERDLLDDFKRWLEESGFSSTYGLPRELSERGLVTRFLTDMDYYRWLLVKINARLVLVVCSYAQEAVTAAARSLGIPVWELQHGMISENHFGYNYSESAVPYKEALPIPDRILTFGRYFSEVLLQTGYWREKQLFPLGFARLSHFGERVDGAGGVTRGGNLNVMISTQWTIDDEYFSFITRLLDILPASVRLIINPHHRSLSETWKRYRSISGDRVEVMNPAHSIYDKAGEIGIHCSVYSTTLFESVGMGIPTLIIKLPGWRNVKTLEEEQAALSVENPQGLDAIARRSLEDSAFYSAWKERTGRKGSYYFETFDRERAAELFSEDTAKHG